jgi:predicted transcriptional regulator
MPRGRPEKPTPSERELDVMSVLWDLGSGTVAEVREELIDREEFELAYTTVLTLLRSLRAKGWVKVVNERRAHRYFPARRQEHARGEALRRITSVLFGGSRELLLTELVSERGMLPGTLKRLRRVLDERLKGQKP